MNKMFLKITGLVLVIVLAGLAGCGSPILPQVQDGRGKVMVTIGLSEAKTLYPFGIEDEFDSFVLSFTGPSPAADVALADGVFSKEVELAPGNWTITAKGLIDGAIVAIGSKDVTVSAGGNSQVTIILKPNEEGKGFFDYEIKGLPVGTVWELKIDNVVYTNAKAVLNLDAGQYLMLLKVEKDGGFTAGKAEILHIYAGLTTAMVFDLEGADWKSPVTKGFDLSDKIAAPVKDAVPSTAAFDTEQFTGTVAWSPADSVFAADTVYTALVTLEAKDGYTLLGVDADAFNYNNANASFNVATGVVTIVFPKTAPLDPGTINVTIGFAYGKITINGSDGANVIYKNGDPAALELSVSGYTDVSWYIDGKAKGTGNAITVNAAEYNAGAHSVSFIGMNDGILFSQEVPFKVSDIVLIPHDGGNGITFFLPSHPLQMLTGGELSAFIATNVEKADGENPTLTWASSDIKVARVSDGVVQSVGRGNAVITATASNGKSGTFNVTVNTEDKLITNDTFWKDDAGNLIYSQCGDILQVGDTYYWYGMYYAGASTYPNAGATGSSTWTSITCYSSKDLVNWHNEGPILTRGQGNPAPPTGWVGRLGVAYNAATNKYVLMSQGGGSNYVMFATSDTPTGTYTLTTSANQTQGNLNTLQVIDAYTGLVTDNCPSPGTGDQTVFRDVDGTAYIVFSNNGVTEPGFTSQPNFPQPANRRERDIVYIGVLNSSFTRIESLVQVYSGKNMGYGRAGGREANCLFSYNGNYYQGASDLRGWNDSPSYISMAHNVLGPYYDVDGNPHSMPEMEGADDSHTHSTQVAFFVTVDTPKGEMVIHAGDRWSNMAGNGVGYNQWSVLSFRPGRDGFDIPIYNNVSQFYLDIAAGTWTVGPNNNYINNPTFENDRIAGTNGQIFGYVRAPNAWRTWDNRPETLNDHVNLSENTTPPNWVQINYGGNRGSDPYLLVSRDSATPYGNYSWRQSYGQDYQARLEQTVKDLPSGSYTLYAWAMSSGGQNEAKIYINDSNGNELASANINTPMNTWKLVVVSRDLVITDGTCDVGVYSDALANQWVRVDDFALIKNK